MVRSLCIGSLDSLIFQRLANTTPSQNVGQEGNGGAVNHSELDFEVELRPGFLGRVLSRTSKHPHGSGCQLCHKTLELNGYGICSGASPMRTRQRNLYNPTGFQHVPTLFSSTGNFKGGTSTSVGCGYAHDPFQSSSVMHRNARSCVTTLSFPSAMAIYHQLRVC